VAVVIGLAIFAIVVRRWTARRRARVAAAPVTPPSGIDPAMRERIRRELELEGER
jgi:hypothetical protein